MHEMTGREAPQLAVLEPRAVVAQSRGPARSTELQAEDSDANCRQRAESSAVELQE